VSVIVVLLSAAGKLATHVRFLFAQRVVSQMDKLSDTMRGTKAEATVSLAFWPQRLFFAAVNRLKDCA
jgi:hypothetical protein